jgi:cytosine/uracil/thiamine/allantoin permease
MLNTAAAMVIFFAGSLALIFVFVETPSIQYYTGGVIIGLFIAGIVYAWGNSIIQTRRLNEELKNKPDPSSSAPSSPSS